MAESKSAKRNRELMQRAAAREFARTNVRSLAPRGNPQWLDEFGNLLGNQFDEFSGGKPFSNGTNEMVSKSMADREFERTNVRPVKSGSNPKWLDNAGNALGNQFSGFIRGRPFTPETNYVVNQDFADREIKRTDVRANAKEKKPIISRPVSIEPEFRNDWPGIGGPVYSAPKHGKPKRNSGSGRGVVRENAESPEEEFRNEWPEIGGPTYAAPRRNVPSRNAVFPDSVKAIRDNETMGSLVPMRGDTPIMPKSDSNPLARYDNLQNKYSGVLGNMPDAPTATTGPLAANAPKPRPELTVDEVNKMREAARANGTLYSPDGQYDGLQGQLNGRSFSAFASYRTPEIAKAAMAAREAYRNKANGITVTPKESLASPVPATESGVAANPVKQGLKNRVAKLTGQAQSGAVNGMPSYPDLPPTPQRQPLEGSDANLDAIGKSIAQGSKSPSQRKVNTAQMVLGPYLTPYQQAQKRIGANPTGPQGLNKWSNGANPYATPKRSSVGIGAVNAFPTPNDDLLNTEA